MLFRSNTAKATALACAGLSEGDVSMMECELDANDAVPHFDVSFKANGMEYDCDIDAVTGNVLAYEEGIDD